METAVLTRARSERCDCYLCTLAICVPLLGMGTLAAGLSFLMTHAQYGDQVMTPGKDVGVDRKMLGYLLVFSGCGAIAIGAVVGGIYFSQCCRKHNRVHSKDSQPIPSMVVSAPTSDKKDGEVVVVTRISNYKPKRLPRQHRHNHRKLHSLLELYPEFPTDESTPKPVSHVRVSHLSVPTIK